MKTTSSIREIRKERWRHVNATWGLVPTMGFLHEGHLSLVRQARQENDCVGVSIFVNPMQFNERTDFQKYPRDLERDLHLLKNEGVDLVWTPGPEAVYPPEFQTHVEVERISQPLEGAARPGHFRGVATVVAKLFNIFQPQRAYFGQKDAQQAIVIRRLVTDLNFDLDVIICPTVREKDGLAMSSRNARLSHEARAQAVCLYQSLWIGQNLIANGEVETGKIKFAMQEQIRSFDKARIDYISLANPETLWEIETVQRPVLISVAVFVDGVRLIDNIFIE
ncbi:MAG: pantoate--beta-alanine ligase [bacterium]